MMSFELGKLYHGFKLIEQRDIKEINGVGRLFEHEKSGARLFSLKNDDDNKTFTISFKTPPYDSTGLPHILEHSVLCGSRKFPTKEPFVDLIKGSLNTFLNAFTFADKTMYPLASRNDKDFMNLMDVYLDAVFYPNLHKTKEILMQEGWHYEIENREDPLTYKGVVYNEMKGAFSSAEGVLFRKIQETLFKDTPYVNESGGDPEFIPDLTQEKFTEFHKKYYHPCNSYITLYGDGDLDKQLEFIDREYLKDFDRIDVDSHIDLQEPYAQRVEVEKAYSISADEDENDKTFFSLNFVAGNPENPVDHLGVDILEYLLLETQASPLKNALVEANIGKDVYGSFDTAILQPTLSIIVKNTNKDKKDEFLNIVTDTLQKLVDEGIDKKLIEACVNSTEFKLRENESSSYPKGIVYAMNCLESWLYGKDPFTFVEYDKLINEIRNRAENGYFEELIKKYLLDNKHSSMLTLVPDKELAGKNEAKLKEKLSNIKKSLSEEELDAIIKDVEVLKKRQNTKDSEEDLKTIPLLDLDDIDKNAEKIDTDICDINDIKLLHTKEFTNKILYLTATFDTSSIEENLVPYLRILSYSLGKLSTEKRNFDQLSNEININTGGVYFTADAYVDVNNEDKYYRKFSMRGKALTSKANDLIELMAEIISSTKFSEFNKIHELIRQLKSRIEMNMIERGHRVAFNRLISYFSPAGSYMENINGIGFYKFISDLEKNFESKKEEIKNNLEQISRIVFNKNNLIISVVGEEEELTALKDNINKILQVLGNEKLEPKEYNFKVERKNEGILTPANVQYVAKGFNINKIGYSYNGKLSVARTIISLDYLWNKVRVQGGAYGCASLITRGGNAGFASYRDPNLKETLEAYNETSEYLNSFEATDREMTKYIIGTISELDYPLSPSVKGEQALGNYIKGLTQEQIQEERNEVLSTTVNDIKDTGKLFADLMKEDFYCVIGNEDKIKENKDIFNNIITLFE